MKSDPADVDGELGGLQREAVNVSREHRLIRN